MLNYKSKILTALLTAALLLGIFPVYAGFPRQPHSGNAVWIEAPLTSISLDPCNITFTTATLPTGNKFNITVWVNFTSITPGDYIGAWGFVIVYDKNILNFTRWDLTDRTAPDHPVRPNAPISQWFKSEGVWKIEKKFSMGSWDADHDYLLPGESWLAPDTGEPDNPKAGEISYGSVCWIEFVILDFPGKYEEIVSSIFFDTTLPVPESKLLDETGGRVDDQFTFYDIPFKLAWAPPTVNPYMALDPTSVTFGPDPPRVNCTALGEFKETIYIKDLDLSWALTNASFTVNYNTALLTVVDVGANQTAFDVAHSWDNTTTPGKIVFYLETSKSLSGNVKAANVTFHVIYQGDYPVVNVTTISFSDIKLMDHVGEIPTRASVPATVTINGVLTLPRPWLEVKFSPSNVITLGPEPVIGKEFTAEIWIKNLDYAWYLIGLEYRLTYCPLLLNVTKIQEGPYLPSHNQTAEPPPTWFYGKVQADGVYGPHVLVGEIIIPVPMGDWPYPLPGDRPPEDGLITTITFKVLDQECWPENLTCALKFVKSKLIAKDGKLIPTDVPVNGTVIVLGVNRPGRMIDVYGGALNRGYGAKIFPAPFGGQGADGNMDLVIPQSVVYLFADITYNYWPVQSKDVGFEIEGPFEQEGWTPEQPVPRRAFHVRKYANRTDDVGVAWIKFQMPWPCVNPEDYFGKYRVTATVDICSVVVTDILWFDYYYLVEITNVATNKYCYEHCEDVEITIEFRSKAQQRYPVLFAIVIQDELETGFGYAYLETFVQGAEFCHWKEYAESVTIHVPKWAFAGIAKIYVSAYDKDPTVGGAPWCPTFGLGWPLSETLPEICIYPW